MDKTITLIVVAIAAFFAAKRIYRFFKGKPSGCGCGKSGGCSTGGIKFKKQD